MWKLVHVNDIRAWIINQTHRLVTFHVKTGRSEASAQQLIRGTIMGMRAARWLVCAESSGRRR
jgi:hypothetical protein